MLILSVIAMSSCLSSASSFPSFKEHTFQGTTFSGCFQIQHLRYGKKDLGIDTIFDV